jgi:hypothetical protein
MNTQNLLARQVRYNGETGLVVSHSEPGSSRRDGMAAQRGRFVTIRIDGQLAPHFIEVTEADLENIEALDEWRPAAANESTPRRLREQHPAPEPASSRLARRSCRLTHWGNARPHGCR